MGKSKLTWEFYSARRRNLSVEKYVETNNISSLDELRDSLKQKGVQLPEPELLEGLFVPEWTGKYPAAPKEAAPKKRVTTKRGSNAKSSKSSSKKAKKAQPRSEKKSTYLQAAYESGGQDDDPDAESGA